MKDACSFLKTAIAWCVLALAAANATAAYPEKPIRLIVPYPPGGLTDAVARQVANALAQQVLVRTIPETGRRALYTASHAVRVIGLPEDESCSLLEQLMAHATQRQFVHTHRWRLHDLVMWDNRCTMHRGTEYDEQRWKRDMHRATVSDIGNTCELAEQRAAAGAA